METPEIHSIKKENIGGYTEALRQKINESADFVIYENSADRSSNEIMIYLKNHTTNETLLDFSDINYFLNKNSEHSNIPLVKTSRLLGFVAKEYPPMIGVPIEAFKDPKEIFGLLHELGHIDVAERKKADILKREQVLDKIGTDEDFLIARLKKERDAWASAIYLARNIKKELGINLFGLFKNADEFMGWLRVTGLRAYEDEMEELTGEKVQTKNKQVEKYLQESLKELSDEVDKNHEI